MWLTFASWFDLAREQVAVLEGMEQQNVLHACEWETSIILRSHGDLVQRKNVKTARTPFKSDFYSPDQSGRSRVSVTKTIRQMTPTGALGRPDLASEEKGERILQVAVAEVVAFVREFDGWQPAKPRAVNTKPGF